MAHVGELSQICEGTGLWKGELWQFWSRSNSNHASGGVMELIFIDIVSKEEGHEIPM